MPRKRVKRERSGRYQIKAHEVLLSNWVSDAYARWHDRDPTCESVANDVRDEILSRLNELKSDVDRILRGDAIEPLQQKKAMEAARLLLYGGVHKMSTLVQFGKAQIVDLESDKVVFDRTITFRGDNAEAWQRAGEFLAEDLLASDLPRTN